MSDKPNTHRASHGKEARPSAAAERVPPEPDTSRNTDFDATFIGDPLSHQNADPMPEDDSASIVDFSATFVPERAVQNDVSEIDATFIGNMNTTDSMSGQMVPADSAVDPDATLLPSGTADAKVDSAEYSIPESPDIAAPAASDDLPATKTDVSKESSSSDFEDSAQDATILSGHLAPPPSDEQTTTPRPVKAAKSGGRRGSGSGISQSGSGSSSRSQMWKSVGDKSVNDLITIPTRSVSGEGQFENSADSDFEVVGKLAEGGMGIVYLAIQKSLNRQLAIKTLKGGHGPGSQAPGKSSSRRALTQADHQKREMFLSEALVTANLMHPNIIPIHELAETDSGMPYYVMKQVHGISWNKRIREMSLEENLAVLHKVCDAVAYAHHKGVINRDLKPENIMLGEFGEILVLDWGLAVPAPHAAEQNFRSPVASYGAGTPAYMSPELWIGPPEAIGECSDIYLLGGILFEIVTGAAPHDFTATEGKRSRQAVWKLIDTVLRQNRIRPTEASGELLDIALKAMRTNPDERFGSVLEFRFAVSGYQRHEESRRLSSRGVELVQAQSDKPHDYHIYQTACALFEESVRTWPGNPVAEVKLRATRLQYATLAAARGDYDLGLQVAAQETDETFVTLSKRLARSKNVRSSVKWTAIAAMFCVVTLATKSIYDNGVITNLAAEVSVKQEAAERAIAEADSAANAMDDSIRKANKANEDAARALADADAAREAVLEADRLVVLSQERQREAETSVKVADVEIQCISIRGKALNQNYSDALTDIKRLLEGPLLDELPEPKRSQRKAELQAQREQLEKRVSPSQNPVQTQAVSPDRMWLAHGDSAGLVTMWKCPGSSLVLKKNNIEDQQFEHGIAALQFADTKELFVATGADLFLWNLESETLVPVEGHEHNIQALDLNQDFLLSADESGCVVIRELQSGHQVAAINLKTQLRDVAFIPGTNDLICAGSRGGESADILAYRIDTSGTETRLLRLGQLRMSRSHNEPPRKLSISPDGRLLVISNSINGDLIVLEAKVSATEAEFPFQQPSDLEAAGDMTWLVVMHDRPVNDIQWSQDGLKCLTASDDRSIGVWARTSDADTALLLEQTLRGHGARVMQAQFLDTEANLVASSSADLMSRLWNLETLEEDKRQIEQAFDAAVPDPAIRRQRAAGPQIGAKYQLTALLDQIEHDARQDLPAEPDKFAASAIPPDRQVSDEDIVLNKAEFRLQRGPVQAICFSHDDQQLIAGAADGSLVIWDTQQRQPVAWRATEAQSAKERFHEGHVFNVAQMRIVGESGTLLATAGYDGSLRLWEMDPASQRVGVQRKVITGLGLVNSFAVSSNGEFLVTTAASDSNESGFVHCCLWNLPALLNSPVTTPAGVLAGGHQKDVTAIAVSLDNQQIATGGRDGIIAVWDAATAQLIASLRSHVKNTSVTSLQWLPDGTLMSSGLDGQLSRWQLQPGSRESGTDRRLTKLKAFRRERTPIEQMHVSDDGQRIVTLSVESTADAANPSRKTNEHHVDVWSATQSNSAHRVRLATVAGKRPSAITSVAWSPAGRRLIICSDGNVQIVDADSWRIERVFSVGHGACTDAQFARHSSQSPDAEMIITFDGTSARLWSLKSGEQIATFRGPFPITSLGVLYAGDQRFVVSGGTSLRVFDGRDNLLTFGLPLFRTPEGMASLITSLDVCPTDSCVFAAGSATGTVTLWRWRPETNYAEKVIELMREGRAVSSCRWSKDGLSVLVVGRDGVLTICAADGSTRHETRLGKIDSVNLLAGEFSPDGRQIVAVGQIAGTSESIGWVVNVDAINHPDETPANGAADPDASDATSLIACTFSGHQAGGISAVGFIPNSPYLVSGGNDGALILWNWRQPLAGSQPMAYEAFRYMAAGQTTAHEAPVTAIAVAESGEIASSGIDGKISIWKIPIKLEND